MAVYNKIQSLKRKKLELSTDIDSLTASSNQLAEKAEISRDMSILVKSTAMRKVCKEKTAKMTAGQAVGRQAPWAEKLWISFIS